MVSEHLMDTLYLTNNVSSVNFVGSNNENPFLRVLIIRMSLNVLRILTI